jgi:menaquinol-cytochrome c reductase cytochrome b/c subunit
MVVTEHRQHDSLRPDGEEHMSDQRRAFLEYKRRVAEHGKPFFPHGTLHDVIAATGVMALLVLLSVMWFGMANCNSPFNVSCNYVSTPLEQHHYVPGEPPSTLIRDEDGHVSHHGNVPVLGVLYEEKADPSTTSYHPRPEWYFYFLFYLLIIFSNPQLVVAGTIIVPTIWLVMLLAWPFVDRRKERRPSRRPVAMAAMVLTAITLLSFTYLGSQAGREPVGGPADLTAAQEDLPGYAVLFEQGVWETCGACHAIGTFGNGNVGPNLLNVGANYDTADDMTEVMAFGLGGGAMPVKGGAAITDEEAAQVSAFLKTLGSADEAEQLMDYGLSDWNRVVGAEEGADQDAAGDDQ